MLLLLSHQYCFLMQSSVSAKEFWSHIHGKCMRDNTQYKAYEIPGDLSCMFQRIRGYWQVQDVRKHNCSTVATQVILFRQIDGIWNGQSTRICPSLNTMINYMTRAPSFYLFSNCQTTKILYISGIGLEKHYRNGPVLCTSFLLHKSERSINMAPISYINGGVRGTNHTNEVRRGNLLSPALLVFVPSP